MASLKVVLLNGAKAKSFSIYFLASELYKLTEKNGLLLGRSKILTQISATQILATLHGLESAFCLTYQGNLEIDVLCRRDYALHANHTRKGGVKS